MLIPRSLFPAELDKASLDMFLSHGWFRMGQGIFTVDSFPFNGHWSEVTWLRFDLHRLQYSRSARRIMAANAGYEVEVKPYTYSEELEHLYSLYHEKINFEAPSTVHGHLQEGGEHNIFETWVVEARHQGNLIAAGIFDRASNSIAGIMNFFHPDYHKKSPGKWMMLLKAKHAIGCGMRYYYPGYIARDYPKFDYKLFVDPQATELYNRNTDSWYPFLGTT